MISLRLFLLSILLSSWAGAAERPNILVILVDDLGVKDIGIGGSTLHRTPHIDRLGREGLVFENAYAAHPRCVPARYGIFSGRLPGRDGVPGFEDRKASKHTLPLSRVTFAEHLQEAGYATGYIGKWHLGKEGGGPDQQGFADSRLAGQAGAPNSYFWPFHRSDKPWHKEHFPEVPGTEGEYLTDRLTKEAISFLRSHRKDPFLLVLAHYAVHTPFEAPKDVTESYRGLLRERGLPEGGTSNDPDFKTAGNATDKTVQNNPVYAAMVGKTDDSVGAVLEELDRLGLTRKTLVILTSDHGGLSTRGAGSKRPLATTNAPYRHGKGWLYDGGVRVPLIVRWPERVKAGTRTAVRNLGVDHYPTILEAAGLDLPGNGELDGVSYLRVLEGGDLDRGPLFFHSPRGRPASTGDRNASALIAGPWKVVEDHASGAIELYNLDEDPGEQHDLAGTEADKLAELSAALRATKERLGTRQGGRNPFAKGRKQDK